MSRALPVQLDPLPGESLPGYTHRLAGRLGVTPRVLLAHSGLTRTEDPPPFWGLIAAPGTTETIARMWSLYPEQIQAMTVAAVPGMDLRDLYAGNPRGVARNAQRRQWLLLSSTRTCPHCWADGYRGKVDWLLPWTVWCPTHHTPLADHPPGQRPPPAGQSTAPPSHPETCVSPEVAAAAAVPREQPSADVWGAEVSAFDAWQAWRAVACLLAAGKALPRWTARPWLSPPRPVPTMAALLTAAHPIVTARDPGRAADLLLHAAPHLSAIHKTGGLNDHTGPNPHLAPLQDALATRLGRPGTVLRRHAAQISLLHPDLGPADLPTLAHPDWLPSPWLAITAPHPLLQRAVLAAAMARMVGAPTWAAAAEHLGYSPATLTHWTRYTLSRLPDGAKTHLAAAAHTALAQTRPAPTPDRPITPLGSLDDLRRWAEGHPPTTPRKPGPPPGG